MLVRSAYPELFFSWNNVFLSQQFHQNSIFQPVSAKIQQVERGAKNIVSSYALSYFSKGPNECCQRPNKRVRWKKFVVIVAFVWYPVLTSVGSNEKAWMLSLQLAVYIFAVNLIPFCHICWEIKLLVAGAAVDLKSMGDERWHSAEHLVARLEKGYNDCWCAVHEVSGP